MSIGSGNLEYLLNYVSQYLPVDVTAQLNDPFNPAASLTTSQLESLLVDPRIAVTLKGYANAPNIFVVGGGTFPTYYDALSAAVVQSLMDDAAHNIGNFQGVVDRFNTGYASVEEIKALRMIFPGGMIPSPLSLLQIKNQVSLNIATSGPSGIGKVMQTVGPIAAAAAVAYAGYTVASSLATSAASIPTQAAAPIVDASPSVATTAAAPAVSSIATPVSLADQISSTAIASPASIVETAVSGVGQAANVAMTGLPTLVTAAGAVGSLGKIIGAAQAPHAQPAPVPASPQVAASSPSAKSLLLLGGGLLLVALISSRSKTQ